MRLLLFGLGIIAASALGVQESKAGIYDPWVDVVYPWCAQYSFSGGATNCGFSSLWQCRAAVSGNGTSFCYENPFYPGAVAAPPPALRRYERRH